MPFKDEYIRFGAASFGENVFMPHYHQLTLGTKCEEERLEYINNAIEFIAENEPEEYIEKSLDAKTKLPVRYNRSSGKNINQPLSQIPAWKSLIIGNFSEPKTVWLATKRLPGMYALRQSFYISEVKIKDKVSHYSQIWGELINVKSGEVITKNALANERAIIKAEAQIERFIGRVAGEFDRLLEHPTTV